MKPIDNKYLGVLLLLISFSVLAQNTRNLDEITVIASRTTNTAEGYVTNLRGADITKGKPTIDVLGFLPNISRENGVFKINGLPVSEIYLDGVKISGSEELRNIPGEALDQIRVKYLAGSDQKANLAGGVIEITLRQPPKGGYYGNIFLDSDFHRSYGFNNFNAGGVINARINQLSIYDNLNVGTRRPKDGVEESLTSEGTDVLLEESSVSHEFSFRNRLSLNREFKSGIHLGGSYLIEGSNPNTSSSSLNNGIMSSLSSHLNALAQQGTVRFMLPLSEKGANMALCADYYNRKNERRVTYEDESDISAAQKENRNLNLWKFKADFTLPHSRRLVWKVGGSLQGVDSEVTPHATVESERFPLNDTHTGTSGFTPIIYANAQGAVWKLKYSAGLSWQMNRIKYRDYHENITSLNTQWAINPTIQLMMPFGSKRQNALMVNYKHTLNDIPYTAISSVINWIDTYSYTVGNPDLKAPSSHMVMAGVSLFRNKLNLTAIYAHTQDRIFWQTFIDWENRDVTYTKPVNMDGQGVWGIGVEWMEKPLRWWRFKLSGRMEITPENTFLNNRLYDKTRFKEYFYFNNDFTFSKGFGGMLNCTLEPTYRTLDRTYHTVYDISGRIYKNFLRNRLQVAIDFTAAGQRRKLTRDVGETVIIQRYTVPVQHLAFSVSWRFSGGKKVDVTVVDEIQKYKETMDTK